MPEGITENDSESRIRLFATPQTIESVEFSSQNTVVGSLSLSPADLPDLGIELGVSRIAGGFFTNRAPWEARVSLRDILKSLGSSGLDGWRVKPGLPWPSQQLELHMVPSCPFSPALARF